MVALARDFELALGRFEHRSDEDFARGPEAAIANESERGPVAAVAGLEDLDIVDAASLAA